jgi:DMSO/TMAO reductase YedYZ molybdopterin-dependent catalytic subunit
MIERISRRRMIASLGAGASGLLLSGCDRISRSAGFQQVQSSAQDLTMAAQRLVIDRNALAREFEPEDMSPVFRTNGNIMPGAAAYRAHAASAFADWRLVVDGLVSRPLSLSLERIRRLPARTQITRHDCVEGWSAIGKWTGLPLGLLLRGAGLRRQARYIVFHCADDFHGIPYYESIDLIDAFHPQTILAWAMNDRPLEIGHGAPLRLRVERQLGYKHAKYVMRIEAVESLARIGLGKGGYWEDRAGYQWYAGI